MIQFFKGVFRMEKSLAVESPALSGTMRTSLALAVVASSWLNN